MQANKPDASNPAMTSRRRIGRPRPGAADPERQPKKMIRDFLEPALRARFPDLPFAFREQNAPFATLAAPCPEVGRLELCDDGDEVTVYFTEIAHGHFGCYDDATVEEKERSIAEDVADFLAALFIDRVVLFRVVGGLAGGWSRLTEGQALPAPSRLKRQYVWSGAILNQKKSLTNRMHRTPR